MTVADLWEFIKKYTNNNNPFAFSNGYYGDTAGCGDQNDWENVAHCTGSSSTGCNIPGPCARNKCRRASSDRLTLPRSAHATCNCLFTSLPETTVTYAEVFSSLRSHGIL